MNDKFVITGEGNDGFRHKYIINKDDSFFKIFFKFLDELGIDVDTYDFEDEKGNIVSVKLWKDGIDRFKNDEFDIDLFYGDKKLIMLIRTNHRTKLLKLLEKYSVFKELKIRKTRKTKA